MERMHNLIAAVGGIFFLWFSLPFVVNGIINIGNGTGMLVSMAVLSYGISYEKINHKVTELWRHPWQPGAAPVFGSGCGGMFSDRSG